jgi:hypothetical protein
VIPDDRVKLSALGVDRILGEIIEGKLPHGMRRRSCHNRKLTGFSVGTVVGGNARGVRVKFDEMSTVYVLAPGFLRKTLRILS